MAWDWDKLQQQKKSSSGGGGERPPSMDDVIEKFRGAKGKFPGGIWMIVILVIIIFLATSSFYTIDVEEVGIVQRFGKFNRITYPGLNFKFPRGIEKVTKVPVKRVLKEEFGFRTIEAGVRSRFAPDTAYEEEFLMLTGDLNVAVVPWVVQYRINDPYKYLFKVQNVNNTLRDLAESTMRVVVGDRSINEVITKRQEIATAAEKLLQEELDQAETGISISTIEMKKTNVPEPVRPSFNMVNQAVQEKERLIYRAREEYNKVIPEAKGNAEKTIKAAEGYALDRVNRAEGDASRFLALYQEYSKAKDVTRRRLYLEALLEIFPNMGEKYIIDENLKGLLPLLDLKNQKGGVQ